MTRKSKVKYTDDLGTAAEFEGAKPLSKAAARALGIPSPNKVAMMPVVRAHGGTRPGAGKNPSTAVEER